MGRRLLSIMFVIILMIATLHTAALSEKSEWESYSPRPYPVEVVPWDELPPENPDQHHYLLLVLDQRYVDPRPEGKPVPDKNYYGYTDGIVILTLDTRAKRIMMTSIIRDALIRKPNSTETEPHYGRINRVFNDYGPDALCRLISEHVGVRIEKYMMFTFRQVEDIIGLDILGGGVDVELKSDEIRYLRSGYEVSPGWVVSTDGKYDVARDKHAPQGTYHLKPWAAVLYMRMRKGVGGDLMRTQRARNVLSALADKCRQFTWDEAKALANELANRNNQTNMSVQEIVEAAGYAFQLRDCTIEEMRIPEDEDTRSLTYAAMAVKEINWTSVRAKMENYLQNSFLVIEDE